MADRFGPRALLVDFGGVLTTSLAVSFAAFCARTGVDPQRLRDLLAAAYGSPADGEGPSPSSLAGLVAGVETGAIAVGEFDRRLALALGDGMAAPPEPAGISAALFEAVAPDEEMIEAVRRARAAGLRTAVVSNTWGPLGGPDRFAGRLDELFDASVLSGEVGLRKPGPEIYRLAAERLGAEPEACVFVDDIPANVEGARAVGMAGVLHRGAAVTLPKLEALFRVPLAG